MQAPLIAISGFRGCGKDTAFDAMARAFKTHDLIAGRAAFADKMKLCIMRSLFPGELDDRRLVRMADNLKAPGAGVIFYIGSETVILEGRTFWQRFGTEGLRATYGEDFHVEALLPHSGWRKNWPNWTQIPVITDCRFPNEAQRVLDLGGEVWEIVRPEIGPDGHRSEQPLPRKLVTLTIANDSTCDEFMFEKIPAKCEEYRARHALGRGMMTGSGLRTLSST